MRGEQKDFAAAQRGSRRGRGKVERVDFKTRISALVLRNRRTARHHGNQYACPVRPHIDPGQKIEAASDRE
jgi:hypothetical protein